MARRNVTGEKIYIVRRAKGWSQDRLAAQLQVVGLDIDRVTVSRIELGKRPVHDYELVVIARVLEVQVVQLLPDPGHLNWLRDIQIQG